MSDQRDPSQVIKDIRAKSKLIDHLKSHRDRGGFKSVGDAVNLQKALRDRQRLMDELPPLRIVI